MCKLVTIETSDNNRIKVADVKADIIKQILALAESCSKIDYIYIFGSSLEERCTKESDIDIAIISNVTRSKLFNSKDYSTFTSNLYQIDLEQEYDILQFNSIEAIRKSEDFVCKDIISKGKLLYRRKGA